MLITEVYCQQLRSYGNYQNLAIGARAMVQDGESPEVVVNWLNQWLIGELNVQIAAVEKAEWNKGRVVEHLEAVEALEEELRTVMAKINAAEEKWYGLKHFFERLQLNASAVDVAEIPF